MDFPNILETKCYLYFFLDMRNQKKKFSLGVQTYQIKYFFSVSVDMDLIQYNPVNWSATVVLLDSHKNPQISNLLYFLQREEAQRHSDLPKVTSTLKSRA